MSLIAYFKDSMTHGCPYDISTSKCVRLPKISMLRSYDVAFGFLGESRAVFGRRYELDTSKHRKKGRTMKTNLFVVGHTHDTTDTCVLRSSSSTRCQPRQVHNFELEVARKFEA